MMSFLLAVMLASALPQSRDAVVETDTGPLEVRVWLSAETIRPYEPLYAHVMVVNGSTEVIRASDSILDGVRFELRQGDRSQVLFHSSAGSVFCLAPWYELPPGGRDSRIVMVPKRDAWWASKPGYPDLGEYQLRARVGFGDAFGWSKTVEVCVEGEAAPAHVIEPLAHHSVILMLSRGWQIPARPKRGLTDLWMTESGIERLRDVLERTRSGVFRDHVQLTLGRNWRRSVACKAHPVEHRSMAMGALDALRSVSATNSRLRALALIELAEAASDWSAWLDTPLAPVQAELEGLQFEAEEFGLGARWLAAMIYLRER